MEKLKEKVQLSLSSSSCSLSASVPRFIDFVTLTTLILGYSFGCQYFSSTFTNRFIFSSNINFTFLDFEVYSVVLFFLGLVLNVVWKTFLFQHLQMYVHVIRLMVHGLVGHVAKGNLQCK